MKNDKVILMVAVLAVILLVISLAPVNIAQSQGSVTKDICFEGKNGVKLKGKVTDRGTGFSDYDLKDVSNSGRTTQITFTTFGAGRNGPFKLDINFWYSWSKEFAVSSSPACIALLI